MLQMPIGILTLNVSIKCFSASTNIRPNMLDNIRANFNLTSWTYVRSYGGILGWNRK